MVVTICNLIVHQIPIGFKTYTYNLLPQIVTDLQKPGVLVDSWGLEEFLGEVGIVRERLIGT